MSCPTCYQHSRQTVNRGHNGDPWTCPACHTTHVGEAGLCLHVWRDGACIHCGAAIRQYVTQPP